MLSFDSNHSLLIIKHYYNISSYSSYCPLHLNLLFHLLILASLIILHHSTLSSTLSYLNTATHSSLSGYDADVVHPPPSPCHPTLLFLSFPPHCQPTLPTHLPPHPILSLTQIASRYDADTEQEVNILPSSSPNTFSLPSSLSLTLHIFTILSSPSSDRLSLRRRCRTRSSRLVQSSHRRRRQIWNEKCRESTEERTILGQVSYVFICPFTRIFNTEVVI